VSIEKSESSGRSARSSPASTRTIRRSAFVPSHNPFLAASGSSFSRPGSIAMTEAFRGAFTEYCGLSGKRRPPLKDFTFALAPGSPSDSCNHTSVCSAELRVDFERA